MRKFYIVLVALIAVFTCACNSKPMTEPSGEGQARAAAKATQEPVQMALATDPGKPQVDKPFTMRVHLTNQGGAVISDATVTGELTMKTMDHGKQQLDFASKGNGDYEVMAKAVMSGPWQLKVTAKSGAMIGVKDFEVQVGE